MPQFERGEGERPQPIKLPGGGYGMIVSPQEHAVMSYAYFDFIQSFLCFLAEKHHFVWPKQSYVLLESCALTWSFDEHGVDKPTKEQVREFFVQVAQAVSCTTKQVKERQEKRDSGPLPPLIGAPAMFVLMVDTEEGFDYGAIVNPLVEMPEDVVFRKATSMVNLFMLYRNAGANQNPALN